jgi:hypothetical protein
VKEGSGGGSGKDDDNDGDNLLGNWMQRCVREGLDTSSLVATVEIVGADGAVQRVYFPIPAFVSLYWPYPEVQKAKEDALYTVSRDSPEEKIADFFRKMEGITLVMRRQEALRYALSPIVHAIFGGKPLTNRLRYIIPPQRLVFIILTFVLNVYYCYESVYGYDEHPVDISSTSSTSSSPSLISTGLNSTSLSSSSGNSTTSSGFVIFPTFIKPFWFWAFRGLTLLILRYIHFGLTFSLALRSIMNSRILDDIPDVVPKDILFKRGTAPQRLFGLVVDLVQMPRSVLLLIYDSALPLLFLGCSIAGCFFGRIWFYALCLIDIVFQVRYMSFLVTAISKNVIKISFTILLAALFLYLFSVGTFLFFPNQYALNGHIECQDVASCWKSHLVSLFMNSWLKITDAFLYSLLLFSWISSKIANYQLIFIAISGLRLQQCP